MSIRTFLSCGPLSARLGFLEDCLSQAPAGTHDRAREIQELLGEKVDEFFCSLREIGLADPGDDRIREIEAVLYGCIKESNPQETALEEAERFGEALAAPAHVAPAPAVDGYDVSNRIDALLDRALPLLDAPENQKGLLTSGAYAKIGDDLPCSIGCDWREEEQDFSFVLPACAQAMTAPLSLFFTHGETETGLLENADSPDETLIDFRTFGFTPQRLTALSEDQPAWDRLEAALFAPLLSASSDLRPYLSPPRPEDAPRPGLHP